MLFFHTKRKENKIKEFQKKPSNIGQFWGGKERKKE